MNYTLIFNIHDRDMNSMCSCRFL